MIHLAEGLVGLYSLQYVQLPSFLLFLLPLVFYEGFCFQQKSLTKKE